MSFLATIFENLEREPERAKLIEIHLTTPRGTDGTGLLDLIARARGYFTDAGVQPGDRIAQLATNSVRWVATDLAVLAHGAITVPVFDRSTPREIGAILRSAAPSLVVVANAELRRAVEDAWPERGDVKIVLHEDVFAHASAPPQPIHAFAPEDPIAIIYTSGTSGEPKGVVLTRANLDFMIPRTRERLERATGGQPEQVFHFLPFCFAASRLMLWTQLSRPHPLLLSTDITKFQAEFASAKPSYFLTVPMVLERLKNGVGEELRKKGGVALSLYERGLAAHRARAAGQASVLDHVALSLANAVVFKAIRKKVMPNLQFVISGSAPLNEDTQRWFQALGVPVYQAYGLTETTGIVSLDEPDQVVPGRVGRAIDGVEVRLGEDDELLVRGPNLFPGYWHNPEATTAAFQDDWFRTGDQVEIAEGNLKIIGRIKNLLVPESGHNVAPEPLEQRFAELCPTALQTVIVGHARPFLTVIVTGNAQQAEVDAAIETFNAEQPYYKKIKGSILDGEPLTADRGLLTPNLKLRRAAIEAHYEERIHAVYTRYYAEKRERERKAAAE